MWCGFVEDPQKEIDLHYSQVLPHFNSNWIGVCWKPGMRDGTFKWASLKGPLLIISNYRSFLSWYSFKYIMIVYL